jgi:hypothetical protein
MAHHVTSSLFVLRHKQTPLRQHGIGRRASLLPHLTSWCFPSLSFRSAHLSTSTAVSTLVTLTSNALSTSLKSPGAFLPPGIREFVFFFLVGFPFFCTKSCSVSLEPSSSSLELLGLCSSTEAFLGPAGVFLASAFLSSFYVISSSFLQLSSPSLIAHQCPEFSLFSPVAVVSNKTSTTTCRFKILQGPRLQQQAGGCAATVPEDAASLLT